MTGLPDEPENYHTITYEIDDRGGTCHLSLSQDNNADEAEAEHARQNSSTMRNGLKDTADGRRPTG